MRYLSSAILASMMLAGTTQSVHADIQVVTSIKPVHSLVSGVMEGVGTPSLLMEGAGSPHSYALKPSQASILQEADIIFWVGKNLETFLDSAIDNIATNSVSVPLIHSHGLSLLPLREGGAFDGHDHEDHEDHDKHDGHDGHGHNKDSHDDHKDDHDGHGHDEHEKHEHAGSDQHVWLDPKNAQTIVHEIAEHLAEIDSEHADIYMANAASMRRKLDRLVTEIDAALADIKGRPYIVFHDAYQYFEQRFGMSATGSITVSPEHMPGADRIRVLQQKIIQLEAVCVFSEPQFEPKLVATVTENTAAGSGVLDPLGTSIEKGPALYATLIRNMAASLKDCLANNTG